eukprot:9144418-Ditylum_brightwellii.AAC.1
MDETKIGLEYDYGGAKEQKLPDHTQQSTLTQGALPVKCEQTEVGLLLGITDGIKLILGSDI